MWRSNLLLLAALLFAGLSPAAAATGEDPDWTCIQRLVPQIAPAVIWPGPPIDQVNGPANPRIHELAGELAARRVPMATATAQIEAFAAGLDNAQKNQQLIKLFVRTL